MVSKVNTEPHATRNGSFDTFNNIISEAKENFVRFRTRKHKKGNWITMGILRSIEFRDKLYKRYP